MALTQMENVLLEKENGKEMRKMEKEECFWSKKEKVNKKNKESNILRNLGSY